MLKNQNLKVKNVVNLLKQQGISEGQEHKKIYRPWGFYESIIDEERWQVKIINVKPGKTIFTKTSPPIRTLDSGEWDC